jgi:hypothetical protein
MIPLKVVRLVKLVTPLGEALLFNRLEGSTACRATANTGSRCCRGGPTSRATNSSARASR